MSGFIFPKKSLCLFSSPSRVESLLASMMVTSFTPYSFFFTRETKSQNLSSPPSAIALVLIMPNTIASLHGWPSYLLHPWLHISQTVEANVTHILLIGNNVMDDSNCLWPHQHRCELPPFLHSIFSSSKRGFAPSSSFFPNLVLHGGSSETMCHHIVKVIILWCNIGVSSSLSSTIFYSPFSINCYLFYFFGFGFRTKKVVTIFLCMI